MGLSRRQLLKRGFFGGLLLSLGGAGFLLTRSGKAVALPPEGLKVFSPEEYAVVDALAARMIPTLPGAPSADEVRVAFIADRLLHRADPSAQKELKQLLGLLESAALGFLFDARREAFTALPPDHQLAVLRAWETSRVTVRRTGLQALRSLVLSCYYGSPRVWPALDYPGPSKSIHWAPTSTETEP